MKDSDANHHPSVVARYEAARDEAARLGYTLKVGGRGTRQFVVESRTATVLMCDDIEHVAAFLGGIRHARKRSRAK